MNITTAIDYDWCNYDKVVGECQLISFGVIFLDNYGCPIDDDFELDELWAEYQKEVENK